MTLLTEHIETPPVHLPPAGPGLSSLLGDLFADMHDIDEDIENDD